MCPVQITHIEGKQTLIPRVQLIEETPHVIVIETELVRAEELQHAAELVYLAIDLDHSREANKREED